VARMRWQTSGTLQVQFSLMLVLEISKAWETTWRTSVKETLQKVYFLPFLSQPLHGAAARKP